MTTAISPVNDRKAWLKERRRGIGASESPIVLGLTGSRLRLFYGKTDEIEPEPPSEAMEIGLEMEPIIGRWYERRTGRKIAKVQHFLRHPEMPWLLATLDAITECGRTVEMKTCDVFSPEGRRLGDDGESETVPDKWVVQLNHQLALGKATGETDGENGDIIVWINNKPRIFPFRRSDALWRVVADEVEAFWAEHVEAGIPPDDLQPGDASLLTKVFRRESGEILTLGQDAAAWALAYQDLGRRIRELEQERDIQRARLLLALGNAAGAELPNGLSVEREVITVNRRAQAAATTEQVRLTVKGAR